MGTAKKRLTKKQWMIVGGACAAAVVVAVLGLTAWRAGDATVYDEIRREAAPVETLTPTAAPTPTPTPGMVQEAMDTGVRPADREIDFEALSERNPDIVGWIAVPGTEIDYPVLKSKDNVDYLEHDVDGEENLAGAIFMDMANYPGFLERNVVIYGHNMKNGTMFAGLHQFEEKEFFDENREIKVYTREGMRTYEVIRACATDDRNILYQTDYTDDAVWEAYIDEIYANKDMSANLLQKPIGPDDRVLTLSTCVRGEGEQRYMVQGLLKKDES